METFRSRIVGIEVGMKIQKFYWRKGEIARTVDTSRATNLSMIKLRKSKKVIVGLKVFNLLRLIGDY